MLDSSAEIAPPFPEGVAHLVKVRLSNVNVFLQSLKEKTGPFPVEGVCVMSVNVVAVTVTVPVSVDELAVLISGESDVLMSEMDEDVKSNVQPLVRTSIRGFEIETYTVEDFLPYIVMLLIITVAASETEMREEVLDRFVKTSILNSLSVRDPVETVSI